MSDYIEGGNKPLQEGSNLNDLVSGKYVAKNTGSNTPMKSYILRDAAINEIYHHFPSLSHVEAAMVLHTVPSADVVEVVRCKDCKYGMSYESIFVFCHLLKIKVNEEGFCYLGGRGTDAKIY